MTRTKRGDGMNSTVTARFSVGLGMFLRDCFPGPEKIRNAPIPRYPRTHARHDCMVPPHGRFVVELLPSEVATFQIASHRC